MRGGGAVHIHAPPVGQQHRQHGTQHIQRQRAQMQQHIRQLPPQQVNDQLQQVHGLGVAHDAAVYQHGIAPEKTAHRAERQMAVKVDMIVFRQLFHGNAAFLTNSPATQYSRRRGKGKGKIAQIGKTGGFSVDNRGVRGTITASLIKAMTKKKRRGRRQARQGGCEPVGTGAAWSRFRAGRDERHASSPLPDG